MHLVPRLISRESYIKRPAEKVKTFFEETSILGKMPIILENFRPFLCEKSLFSGPYFALITPASE